MLGSNSSITMYHKCAFTYQFTKEVSTAKVLNNAMCFDFRLRALVVFEKLQTASLCASVYMCVSVQYECECVLPGKMELRLTGGWLVSTVILNLVVLAGEVGTHTNAKGRLNLDWRTLGTPEKKKMYKIFSFFFPFCVAFSCQNI